MTAPCRCEDCGEPIPVRVTTERTDDGLLIILNGADYIRGRAEHIAQTAPDAERP